MLFSQIKVDGPIKITSMKIIIITIIIAHRCGAPNSHESLKLNTQIRTSVKVNPLKVSGYTIHSYIVKYYRAVNFMCEFPPIFIDPLGVKTESHYFQ